MTESANGARVVVRLGTEADAPAAALLHSASISEGFLAALGPRFLTRLYRRVVRSPDAFLLVADGGGSTAGFLAGALDLRALYRRFLLHDGLPAALSSLPRLFASRRQAWETLRHGTGGTGSGSGGTGPESAAAAGAAPSATAELLAIAVDPGWRGHHVGALLVEGFVSEVEKRGGGDAQVVVGAENAVAIALYRRSGFETDHSFELHRGTTSLVMRRPGGRA
jgi:ribosomal protein S18 acetylase RimI-like enzyme